MVDAESRVFRAVRCRYCRRLFYLCSECARGQVYCSEACRSVARRDSKRRARRVHQRSEEGRYDHRDRMRCFRKKRQKQQAGSMTVMDHGCGNWAISSKLCLPESAQAVTLSASVAVGQKEPHDNNTSDDCVHSNANSHPSDTWPTRHIKSDTPSSHISSSSRSYQTSRRARDVATRPPLRCAACGALGWILRREGIVRRSRIRRAKSVLRRSSLYEERAPPTNSRDPR
jgi:hypothetical protein